MARLRRVAGTSIYHTPDSRFDALPEFPFAAHYVDIEDPRLGTLRMHYVDENAQGAQTVLLLHGEPSWSYLYRKMIPPLVAAGLRVIAPDLVGFGRSDKPGAIADYSYAGHVGWMTSFVDALGLRDINLFCQDWGGLIGLRVVASAPDRFARLAIANTGLPDGSQSMPPAFIKWQRFARWSPYFPIGKIIERASQTPLSEAEQRAYDAPFPGRCYKAAARALPLLVPTSVDDPGAVANRAAWQVLETFDKPVLTLFSDKDPVTRGGEAVIQRRIPGAKGQPHETMRGGGHFLQEDVAPELATALIALIRN